MPTKKFDPKSAELHLGIIQNKLQNCLGKKQRATNRMSMDEAQREDMKIDLETEKLNWEAANKEYEAWELRLAQYENAVLKLTELE